MFPSCIILVACSILGANMLGRVLRKDEKRVQGEEFDKFSSVYLFDLL
jgi:hypothetical protein